MSALSGELPPGVEPSAVAQVVWVSAARASAAQASDCRLQPPRRWSCDIPSAEDDAGVVVIETDAGVAFVITGTDGAIASGVAPWGRLVRVLPANEEMEVAAAALQIRRPVARPNTRVLDVEADDDVSIWPIRKAAFWIAGTTRSPDRFVRLAAEQSATHDEPLETIAGDGATVPLDITLQTPLMLEGRVEANSGVAVTGAVVDLFTLRPDAREQPTPQMLKVADVMRVAETRTDEAGAFAFHGLEPQIFKVAVVDFEHGRAERWARLDETPLRLRLKAPSTANGRVLRQRIPVAGVVVRFIPDAAAWRESSDPAAHLTLDASTEDDGRFSLRLPPEADGTVQLTAPDGASKRVRLPRTGRASDIAVGDIELSDPIAAAVQTDIAGCTVSAAGPAGATGFSVVRAKADGIVHVFDFPEAGQWLLQVECGGVQRRVIPASLDVSAKGELSTRTLHVE